LDYFELKGKGMKKLKNFVINEGEDQLIFF